MPYFARFDNFKSSFAGADNNRDLKNIDKGRVPDAGKREL
jgi:hypothetical protein